MTNRPKSTAFSAEALDAATRAKRERQARHDQAVGPRIHELRAQGLSWNRVAQVLERRGGTLTPGVARPGDRFRSSASPPEHRRHRPHRQDI